MKIGRDIRGRKVLGHYEAIAVFYNEDGPRPFQLLVRPGDGWWDGIELSRNAMAQLRDRLDEALEVDMRPPPLEETL